MRAMLREDVALALAVGDDTAPVVADRPQLERVLLNLVLNARDATAGVSHGEVRIETRSEWLAEPDRRRLGVEIPQGEYTVLVVRDNGRGMSPEVRSRAFEPFFTTKRAEDALGLGLSTAYGIVKQSGGFIALDSEPGNGTTVPIYLPAARAPTAPLLRAAPAPAPGEADPSAAGPTVLLVEDEESVRTMAARILRQKGFAVLEAEDGTAALAALGSYDGPLDLILTDVVMPGIDGVELAARAGEFRPGTPVLFMSGYSERDFDESGRRGGVPRLNKPFRAGELITAVQKALDAPRPAAT